MDNKKVFIIVLLVAVAAGAWFFFNRGTVPHFGGVINHEIKEEDSQRAITAAYPSVGVDKIDNELKGFIDEQVNNFKGIEYVPYGGGDLQYYLFVEYFYSRFSKDIISFKFNTEYYTGGAHPGHDVVCFAYNLEKEERMELADFFVENSNFLERISDYSINLLMQNEFADEEWIKEGAGQNLNNFQRFILAESGFIFYFPPYQVAPYAMGEQQVIVPFSELKDILNPSIFGNYDFSANKGIYILSPNEGEMAGSFIRVEGYLNGNGWAPFEAVAGRVELLDDQNNVLASSNLDIPGNWMQLPVYFRAYLAFDSKGSNSGSLVFYNDNASGLEENDRKAVVPVKFK
jgi:hypothetical protein